MICMQMSNISERSAFVRFATGATMTAMGIAKYSRNPSCMRARGMMIFGSMKMAEGIFKYCPTKAMLQNNVQSSMQSTVTNMLSAPNMEKIIQDFAKIVSEGKTSQNGGNSSSNTNTNTNNSTMQQAVEAVANTINASSTSNVSSNQSKTSASSKKQSPSVTNPS